MYQLLLLPLNSYFKNITQLLELPSSSKNKIDASNVALGGHYSELLFLQPYSLRRNIAHSALRMSIRAHLLHGFKIESIDAVNLYLGELCSSVVRDQVDGELQGNEDVVLDWEDIVEEQVMLAKFVHLLHHDELDLLFMVCLCFILKGD